MEAYRDQYAKLFNNGRNVAVVAISGDADTTLAAWARELDTPVAVASDTGQVARRLYGSVRSRAVFVIDPSGRIVKRMMPFNELAQTAYDELEAAVKKTLPSSP